jgi:putative transposase
MARLARVVIAGLPHHVTQRGNRREAVFFDDGDYQAYRDLVAAAARRAGTQVWGWCLMPNHVHFIMVPSRADGLRTVLAEAHRQYTGRINARLRQTGHLWQGRFGSVVMDEAHLIAAARYIDLNPVAARLAARPQDWPWSSARAHVEGLDDGLTTLAPLQNRIPDFAAFLAVEAIPGALDALDRAASVGRPLGDEAWLRDLEARTGRSLAPAKRGPKPRSEEQRAGRDGELFSKLSP